MAKSPEGNSRQLVASREGTGQTMSELPVQLNRLIGRDRELTEAARLLTTTRLLTLTGTGGTGKTRLALALIDAVQARFPDSAHVVPLASVREPALVGATIATVLGVRLTTDEAAVASLARALSGRRLLALDNFEHLIEAAPLLADLLVACPDLTLLVTSRAPLRLSGEQEFPVPPLALPDGVANHANDPGQYDAIALFVERARQSRPDFRLTPENKAAVVAICRKVEGLPLAIELAAARIRHLSLETLLARMDRRLPLLVGGARDLPARQRTMRDTIAWSHDLLLPDEQRLLRQLAVFAGGWTLEAAEAVCDPDLNVLEGLATLVDHGLVRPAQISGTTTRFAMLETIREFGREDLESHDQANETLRRHARHMLRVALETEPSLRGPDERGALDRLASEHDNLRVALTWALEHDSELSVSIAGTIWRFWMARGHLAEGLRWLEQAVDGSPDASPVSRATALVGASALAIELGDSKRATWLANEGLRLAQQAEDDRVAGHAHYRLGMIARDNGDIAGAEAHFERALARYRECDDRVGIAGTLNNWGIATMFQGDLNRASAMLEESLALARKLGDTRGIRSAVGNLANVALNHGNPDRAALLLSEAEALARQANDPLHLALLDRALAMTSLARGDVALAHAQAIESLRAFQELSAPHAPVYCLRVIAEIALRCGDPPRAARYLGASETLATDLRLVDHWDDAARVERAQADARAALGDDAYATAFFEGAACPLEEVIADVRRFKPRLADRSASAPQHSLTKREREVLRLLAAGKSNREIGDALYLSVRTVERHIANLYRKIDARNRAEATAFAVQRGLA
jgi:predicted ATPase/DNA-binding NarL/FixJ family response regulator